ncbi:heterokaryon incompatibility protein-domain-containing protein [Apiospora kogelbergensis]|uniref:Heterokaryon incompatibility protein-domain-containing protein n=1 Tax=Apiospora kogelbergensis TaxID=1337665 RepID=A0AAW0Q7D2_9PEZI
MPVEESEADKGPWSLVCTSSAHVFEPGSALPYPTLHFVPTRYLQWGYHHLNIHSWGYLAINAAGRRGDTYPRTILPSAIDVEYLKGIVQNCVASHEGCQASQKKQAEGLRVIDCETQEVVEAPPDCQYFALSYVWGAPAASGDAKGRSKVVQDSITVTREFGCKYLWVDKHCIDQDDKHQQHMFNQMHRVYSKAFVTIVAAAGSDADCGLPGVSVDRPRQINIQLGNLRLNQVFPFDDRVIAKTTWATRAWTYQESYFSPRRLFFTKQQVLYLCDESREAESLSTSRGLSLGNAPMGDYGTSVPKVRRSSWLDPRELRSDIQKYTARQLTKPSDSLNAVLGVMQYYMELAKRARHPDFGGVTVTHLWGIPLYKMVDSQEILIDLAWTHRKQGMRRKDFPSWSWAGWAGGVTWLPRYIGRELNWCFVDDDGLEVTPKALYEENYQGIDQPKGLAMTTRLCRVTLAAAGRSGNTYVLFQVTNDIYAGARCDWDGPPALNDDEYYAASLGRDSEQGHRNGAFAEGLSLSGDRQMILRRRKGKFERIGLTNMTRDGSLETYLFPLFDGDGVYQTGPDRLPKFPAGRDGRWWWYEHAGTQRICIY